MHVLLNRTTGTCRMYECGLRMRWVNFSNFEVSQKVKGRRLFYSHSIAQDSVVPLQCEHLPQPTTRGLTLLSLTFSMPGVETKHHTMDSVSLILIALRFSSTSTHCTCCFLKRLRQRRCEGCSSLAPTCRMDSSSTFSHGLISPMVRGYLRLL